MKSADVFEAAAIPLGGLETPSATTVRNTSNKKLTAFLAAGLISWAIIGLPQPLRAAEPISLSNIEAALGANQPIKTGMANLVAAQSPGSERDASYSALSDFVQLIGAEKPRTVGAKESNKPRRQFDDETYSALREFAQRVGIDRPEPLKGTQKAAEADNSLNFLRGRGAQPNVLAQNEKPKAKRAAAAKSDAVDASFVGEKVCMTCHASHATEFGKTLMGRIGKTQPGKFACENCHGPGSAHVKAGGGRGVGGIISFRKDDTSRTSEENNAICLTCHEKGDRTYWNGSTHETRGLACTNCHTIMKSVSAKKQLKTAAEVDTCFQCHKDRRAQMFRSSHMPLRQGKMTCSSCHNPHGSFTEALLRENSINDNCYKCHAEKRGPFLFEHAPVRENCANCHDPHGSVNEALLKVSRPRLCAECHGFDHEGGIASGPKTRFSFGRACNNCHTQVHGTNSPSGALLHR